MSAKESAIIAHLENKGYQIAVLPMRLPTMLPIEVGHAGSEVVILDQIDLISLVDKACACCIADDIAARVSMAIGTPPVGFGGAGGAGGAGGTHASG